MKQSVLGYGASAVIDILSKRQIYDLVVDYAYESAFKNIPFDGSHHADLFELPDSPDFDVFIKNCVAPYN